MAKNFENCILEFCQFLEFDRAISVNFDWNLIHKDPWHQRNSMYLNQLPFLTITPWAFLVFWLHDFQNTFVFLGLEMYLEVLLLRWICFFRTRKTFLRVLLVTFLGLEIYFEVLLLRWIRFFPIPTFWKTSNFSKSARRISKNFGMYLLMTIGHPGILNLCPR